MEKFSQRLAAALDYKGISAYKLSVLTGLTQSALSAYKKDRTTPRSIVSRQLAQVLGVSYDWLQDGIGEMLDGVVESNVKEIPVSGPQEQIANKNGNVFELSDGKYRIFAKKVPVKAFGSYLSDFQHSEFMENLDHIEFLVTHPGRGNYICFEVEGDSMNGGKIDDSKSGADLLCRELGRQHWKDGFRDSPLGWVIVHKDTVLFKDIKSLDLETGDMVLSSRSGLPQHPDFTINMNDVRQIWKVIKRAQD